MFTVVEVKFVLELRHDLIKHFSHFSFYVGENGNSLATYIYAAL